jgi:flagellar FliL protein
MPERKNAMSDAENPTPEPKKKKGKGKKILLVTLGLLLVGGGGAGAALYAGLISGGHAGPEKPETPHLVPREGVSESEAARYYHPTGDKRPDPAKFKATYYPLTENFTANLRDGSGFVQLGLGVSTYYDERVVEAVKLHEMAVRSAVLLTISEQDPNVIRSTEGKEALKTALRSAVNDTLKKKEGFGGIDDVYFTSLVIQ